MSRRDLFAHTRAGVRGVAQGSNTFTGSALVARHTSVLTLVATWDAGTAATFEGWIEQSVDGVTWTEIPVSRQTLTVGTTPEAHVWTVHRNHYQQYLRARASSVPGLPFMSMVWLEDEGFAGVGSVDANLRHVGVGSFSRGGEGDTARVDRPDRLGRQPTAPAIITLTGLCLPNGDAVCLPNGDSIHLP